MNILIVCSYAEFEAFCRARPDWKDFEVYAARLKDCIELNLAGVRAHSISECIAPEDAETLYARALADAAKIVDDSGFESIINLPRMFKYAYWEFLADASALDYALAQWREKHMIVHYVPQHYGYPRAHGQLVDHQYLINHMLAFVPDVVPIPIKLQQRVSADRILGFVKILRQMASSLKMFLKRVFFSAILIPKGRRAIGWGSTYDALAIMPDLLRTAEETSLEPLLITRSINFTTKRAGLVYRKVYDKIERFLVTRYLLGAKPRRLTTEHKKYVDMAFQTVCSRLDATSFGTRYRLSNYLQKLEEEFSMALRLNFQLDKLLSGLAGSSIVLTHFNGLEERIIEQAAGRYNLSISARTHGWLANPEGYEYAASNYLVPGKLQAEFVGQFFGYGDSVNVVPDPNLVQVAREWLGKNPFEQRELVAQKRKCLNLDRQHVVVFLATASRNRILSDFDFTRLHDEWLKILAYLKTCPNDIHAVVKSHPTFHYNDWLQKMAECHGVTNLTIVNERLEETLCYADLVVNLGYLSTAIIAALLFEKPLLLYRGLCRYFRAFGDIVYKQGQACLINGPTELIEELEKFRCQGHDYLSSLKARNRILKENLT